MTTPSDVRSEIASDLHNGLAQQIAGLLLSAQALRSHLTRRHQPETADAEFLVTQLQAAQSDLARIVTWLDQGRPR